MSLKIDNPIVVLPEPDSPTKPIVSPKLIDKLILLTTLLTLVLRNNLFCSYWSAK